MRLALTDKSLSALKPDKRRYEVHDLHCPGLSVRVSTEGRKTFTVKYRYGSKQMRQRSGCTLATAFPKRGRERRRR